MKHLANESQGPACVVLGFFRYRYFGVILRAVENAVDHNDLVGFINLEQRHIVSDQKFAITALAQGLVHRKAYIRGFRSGCPALPQLLVEGADRLRGIKMPVKIAQNFPVIFFGGWQHDHIIRHRFPPTP